MNPSHEAESKTSRDLVLAKVALIVAAGWFVYSPALHGAFLWDDRLEKAGWVRRTDHPEVLYNFANLQRRLGRTADAIASYELALRYQPDFAFAHYNLAISLREAGRLDAARVHYERARRIDPSLPEVKY